MNLMNDMFRVLTRSSSNQRLNYLLKKLFRLRQALSKKIRFPEISIFDAAIAMVLNKVIDQVNDRILKLIEGLSLEMENFLKKEYRIETLDNFMKLLEKEFPIIFSFSKKFQD